MRGARRTGVARASSPGTGAANAVMAGTAMPREMPGMRGARRTAEAKRNAPTETGGAFLISGYAGDQGAGAGPETGAGAGADLGEGAGADAGLSV